MLAEYARFVKELFPSIDPATTKQLLETAGFKGFTDEQYFATQLGDKLCQGDVVAGLRWVYEKEDGTFWRPTYPGMLMSHSCDVDNDDWLCFAPCFDFDPAVNNAADVKKNEVYDVYYLPPHQGRAARVADFAMMQSMRAERIIAGLNNGSLTRVEHLTPLGYYHFVSKLTVHFLRPQPPEDVRYRCAPPLGERVRYAASASVGLARYAIRGDSA